MKKLYALSISILATASLVAQTTINSSDIANVGQTIQHFDCEADGINPGDAGNNITWNFSNLTPISDTVVLTFIDPATTTHKSKFSAANVAQEEQNNNLSYFELTNSEYNYWGSVANDGNGGEILYTYTDAAKYYSFPLNFNDINSDDLVAGYTADGLNFSRTGTIETEYDGFGTLILPTGTFENVSRIRIHEDNDDEASTFGQTIAINTVITTYQWIQAGNPEPLLTLSEVVVTSFGNVTTSNVVKMSPRKPAVVGIQEENSLGAFKAFPNPTRGQVAFSASSATEVTLMNSTGQVIIEHIHPQSTLDLSHLPAGVYFIQFNNQGEIATQKLIKE